MKLSDKGELFILDDIRRRFACCSDNLIVGIGDDAAAFACPEKGSILASSDMMVEGVHFDLTYFTPFQVGYKLVASNVSDIYAMGGSPDWMLLILSLPESVDLSLYEYFFSGLMAASRRYNLTLIGGDITESKRDITAGLTILGREGGKILRRSGASPGDKVYITGPVGEAALGHEILRRVARPVALEKGERLDLELQWDEIVTYLRRFLLPEVRDMMEYSEKISAMIDISDGLFIDLFRLCSESKVGVRIIEERLPKRAGMKEVAGFFKLDLRALMVSGGEDYQLLFTSGEEFPGFCEIGEVIDEGMYFIGNDGEEQEIKPEGYQHFVTGR
ncbi:thiamine-monophosphate kinase [bacterium BMS3Bbin06]|nr:thiamine-monophosphate kinase [bacterium BMS3Abin08]GBE33568.1 thiamine-monophosphate kinase [bacterium BMS3Bbin06]HDO35345.1 thiamine-phosphate kinase [Nitrospirota bacterium]HDY70615.1 thiamine-phosphate kinase [Nitrospirota bacterium]